MLRLMSLMMTLSFTVLTLPRLPSPVAAQEAATPLPAEGNVAGLVDIGGRNLYLECRGSGGPTVILEAGFRTRADVWSDDLLQPDAPRTMVFPGIASFTRVCAYDRPGTATVIDGQLLASRGDSVPMPRTAAEVVADLRALLDAAGIPGPYVLVGHSFGGLFMRLFASADPDEVGGMVLVDAFPEAMQQALTPEQWDSYEEIFQPVPPALADYTDLELTELDASLDQMRQAAEMTPPRAAIGRALAGANDDDAIRSARGLTGALLEGAWQTGQNELADLTPDARHTIATESEHYIQLQQPELVIDAVRAVVDAVRDPATWMQATPSASPTA